MSFLRCFLLDGDWCGVDVSTCLDMWLCGYANLTQIRLIINRWVSRLLLLIDYFIYLGSEPIKTAIGLRLFHCKKCVCVFGWMWLCNYFIDNLFGNVIVIVVWINVKLVKYHLFVIITHACWACPSCHMYDVKLYDEFKFNQYKLWVVMEQIQT